MAITSAFQKEAQYLTRSGDVLDLICWDYYGRTRSVTEQVLLRNRAVLTTYSAILSAGILIVLPEVTLPVAEGFKLWDYRQTETFKAMQAKIADTEGAVQAALAAFRQDQGSTVSVPSIQVVNIGVRTRIRGTADGAVVEVLGDDGIWYKQQEWTKP